MGFLSGSFNICFSQVALICTFLFAGGVSRAMAEIGFGDFLFGQKWKPGNNLYGIFPMIMGSIVSPAYHC